MVVSVPGASCKLRMPGTPVLVYTTKIACIVCFSFASIAADALSALSSRNWLAWTDAHKVEDLFLLQVNKISS